VARRRGIGGSGLVRVGRVNSDRSELYELSIEDAENPDCQSPIADSDRGEHTPAPKARIHAGVRGSSLVTASLSSSLGTDPSSDTGGTPNVMRS
jgi:hypothetical protein